MKNVVIASSNPHKIAEIKALFAPLIRDGGHLLSLEEAGFSGEIDETGHSYAENAQIKAKAAARQTGLFAVADDSGLSVDALRGKPGVRSARYGGKDATDTEKIDLLLKEMEKIPDEQRKARFIAVFCGVSPEGEKAVFARGECEGYITREKRGAGDFGYDPVFFYPPFGKTFAEMTKQEKNTVSHRAIAARKFIKMLCLDK